MPYSFERAHYEKQSLWSPGHLDSNATARVHIALEWLPDGINTLLDVGCGNGLFANQLSKVPFVVGFDRSRSALQWVNTNRCLGDSQSLPFGENSFDIVFSMELLEHLPEKTFAHTLTEIARVARRYMLITVPYRERLSHSKVICPICLCSFHPYYHMRSFEKHHLENLFSDIGIPNLARISEICPVDRKILPGVWNILRLWFHRGGLNFPDHTTCPQCGYSVDSSSKRDVLTSPGAGVNLKRFLRNLWPEQSTYLWWIALYIKGH